MPARHVFAVFGASDPAALEARIGKAFPASDTNRLPSGDWLVASDMDLVAGVHALINPDNVKPGVACIVSRMDKFYGWHDAAIWDWIEAKRDGR